MTVILLRQHCCPRALDIISAAAEHSSQRRGWNGVLYWKRWEWWMMKVAGEQHMHHFHTLLPQCIVWAFPACMMESSNSQSLVDRILNWQFFALITPHKSEFEEPLSCNLEEDILVLWRSLKPVFAGFHFLYLRVRVCSCPQYRCGTLGLCVLMPSDSCSGAALLASTALTRRSIALHHNAKTIHCRRYHTSKNRFSNHHDTKPCTFADGCLMPVGGQKTAMTPARLADWFPMGPMMCHSSIQVLFVLMIWVLQR